MDRVALPEESLADFRLDDFEVQLGQPFSEGDLADEILHLAHEVHSQFLQLGVVLFGERPKGAVGETLEVLVDGSWAE